MKSNQLADLLASMRTIDELQENLYPKLPILSLPDWEGSKLGDITGNELDGHYRQLAISDQVEVGGLLRSSSPEDLTELQVMSEYELESRKGLNLLQQTAEHILVQINTAEHKFYKWQSMREFAVVELQRRIRQKNVSEGGGEYLDPFMARFLIGPPPPAHKLQHMSSLANKTWLRARVPSGKEVAVQKLRFTIPDAYDSWLTEHLKEKQLWAKPDWYYNSQCQAPRYAEYKIAQEYYKLGFKPDNKVSIEYQVSYNTNSHYHGGWNFNHSREFKTNELTPVD